jgi:hypothetical protein
VATRPYPNNLTCSHWAATTVHYEDSSHGFFGSGY